MHRLSEGRVGYMHLPDCTRLGFAEFHRHFGLETSRAALVLDVRGNDGGYISEMLLEKLTQTLYGWEVPRCGQPAAMPASVSAGPKVLVVDEHTASDGELLAHRFHRLGLGTLVGARTWGGVMCADE